MTSYLNVSKPREGRGFSWSSYFECGEPVTTYGVLEENSKFCFPLIKNVSFIINKLEQYMDITYR